MTESANEAKGGIDEGDKDDALQLVVVVVLPVLHVNAVLEDLQFVGALPLHMPAATLQYGYTGCIHAIVIVRSKELTHLAEHREGSERDFQVSPPGFQFQQTRV
eukprot:1773282-Rhodomonas_salina.1